MQGGDRRVLQAPQGPPVDPPKGVFVSALPSNSAPIASHPALLGLAALLALLGLFRIRRTAA